MFGNICGLKIKLLREKLGWSQVELAAALSVDSGIKIEQSDISEIERRSRGVRDYELRAFADAFSVSADFLLEDNSND